MDVLPAVCKQGVRGSSPLSSTGQGHNSNSGLAVQQQGTATGTAWDAAHAFERGFALVAGGTQMEGLGRFLFRLGGDERPLLSPDGS